MRYLGQSLLVEGKEVCEPVCRVDVLVHPLAVIAISSSHSANETHLPFVHRWVAVAAVVRPFQRWGAWGETAVQTRRWV